jgi:YggT family protein
VNSDVLFVVAVALMVYGACIFFRALLSWFDPQPGSPLYAADRFLYNVTEPYLGAIRRILPRSLAGGAGFDVSPMIGLLVLLIALQVLASL